MTMIEELDNFIEVYLEGSTITDVIYKPLKKKWVLKFNDKTKLEFESTEEMQQWLHADQFEE